MKFKQLGKGVIRSLNEKPNEKSVGKPVQNEPADRLTIPRPVFLRWFKSQLKELCQATALHGYSQIVREGYTPLERAIWIFSVSSAFITATVLLWISWTWNAETPTVTVIESTNYATWNVPFPAVTICNLNKIHYGNALKWAEKMIRPDNLSAEQLVRDFRLLLHINGLAESKTSEYNALHNLMLLNNLEVPQLMGEFAPSCSSMFERCMWKGTQWRCDNLFQIVNTTEGLCCSFNYYGTRSNNYLKKISASIPTEPRRVTASGYQTGLSLILNPDVENYHTTDIATTGFKFLIHNPFDYPDENAETKIVGSNMEAFISILPRETYTTEDAFTLNPVDRNCYAYNEIRMNTMQRYSFVNCMVECRTEHIYKMCQCVPYNLPNNGTYRNCEMIDMPCLLDYHELYSTAIPVMNLSVTKVMEKVPMVCDCLPSCEMVQYPVEMSYGFLNREYSYNSLAFFKDIELVNQTAVHIYFNDLVSTRFRKDIYQNWLGVLASFGGILGLFLGFSIITAFEVVYFFSIRVLFDVFAKPNEQQDEEEGERD
ncbi:sodium channel protein Nach-like [Ochlerotatus camptorhynchus]|uniref:sodium channel protein Nach-like n=1 Tax=Ochlerotatus camptorhynchus TaxID=644619 RepID=UPI0031D8480E